MGDIVLITLLAALTIALPVLKSVPRARRMELSTVSHKVSLMLSPKGAHKIVSNPASQDENLANCVHV